MWGKGTLPGRGSDGVRRCEGAEAITMIRRSSDGEFRIWMTQLFFSLLDDATGRALQSRAHSSDGNGRHRSSRWGGARRGRNDAPPRPPMSIALRRGSTIGSASDMQCAYISNRPRNATWVAPRWSETRPLPTQLAPPTPPHIHLPQHPRPPAIRTGLPPPIPSPCGRPRREADVAASTAAAISTCYAAATICQQQRRRATHPSHGSRPHACCPP